MEVTRAAVVANPSTGFGEATQLFEGCEFIDVDDVILGRARTLADESLRTLDAIHLASALLLGPDELITYDRRLAEAARRSGLRVISPGA